MGYRDGLRIAGFGPIPSHTVPQKRIGVLSRYVIRGHKTHLSFQKSFASPELG